MRFGYPKNSGYDVLNIRRVMQWAFAYGLGVNPKVDPETIGLAILFLRQVPKPCEGTPEVLLTGNLEDIAPTTDFTRTGCL